MIKVTFLGTSGSTPTRYRNLPAIAIERNRDLLLFDCGEGTQRQMMINNVNISKVKAVFLTHIHGDHVLGIAGLVRTLALNRRTEPLQIYIPKGYENAIRKLIDFDNPVINYKIEILPIKGGQIYEGDGFSINSFKLVHTVDTYGLIFEEDKKVHFLKANASKAGLEGSMFKQILKKGSLSIKGRKVSLASVSTSENGKKIVYATDTKPTKATSKQAASADLLIHEATYTEEYKDLAAERGHATAKQCAAIAKSAKVNMLVLTHISARYKDTTDLLSEAKSVFKNTKVAQDGMVITI